jgi:predicted chitinase
MKKINGKLYSKERFDDYKYRARVLVEVTEVKNHQMVRREFHVDVYTDNPNKDVVEKVILDRSAESVTKVKIDWWATREQDEATTELIEEFFNKD